MRTNLVAFLSSCRILEIYITVANKAQTQKLRLLFATYIKRAKYNPLWLGFQFGVCNKRLNITVGNIHVKRNLRISFVFVLV
jgi:hypothetical protein